MTAGMPVVDDWTAQGQRPAGQPGTVNRLHHHPGWQYPAVKDEQERVWYFRETTDGPGRWIWASTGALAESFEPGPDWQADCDHSHAVPWLTCSTEADCVSLRREEERTWGR